MGKWEKQKQEQTVWHELVELITNVTVGASEVHETHAMTVL